MTDKYSIDDLINHASENQPIEFAQAFNDLMTDKLQAAVGARKTELAADVFDSQEESEEPVAEPTEEEPAAETDNTPEE